MKWHLTESRPETDGTDELPILSEESILEFDSRRARPGMPAEDPVKDPLESTIDALRDALDLAERRWTALEARVESQDQAIAGLTGHLRPAEAPLAQAIPILHAVVSKPPPVVRPADLPVNEPVDEAAFDTESSATAVEVEVEVEVESDIDMDDPDPSDSKHLLLEKIASLESYIAGRADRWQEMEQEIDARARRITELEIELEQRIEREQRLQDRLHNENDRANELRDKLRRMHRRIEEAEIDSADQTLDATRELVGRVIEGSSVRFHHEFKSTDSDLGHAPRIFCLSSALPMPFILQKDAITIGRAPDCDIQIATDFVSRRHATIRHDNTGTFIEDWSSTNGVFVNAVRIDRKALTDGDEITIGESRFRFVAGEPLN
jgi:hypothetical protein